MAIIFNDQQNKSQLQQRIAAELRQKQTGKSQIDNLPTTEFDANNSQYTKDLKTTTSLAWLWAVIGLMAVVALIIIIAVVS
jgi:type IV secretory pathway component VirB8